VELANLLLEKLSDLVEENPAAHETEHSLEVQCPFLRELFPGVPVLPIMVPPEASPVELGTRLAEILPGRETVVVATTDLTHYGSRYGFHPAGPGDRGHRWMQENDRRILDLAVGLEAEQIPHEAAEHLNACGSGALAAAVALARDMGAEAGTVLEYTDSYEVEGRGEPFMMAVGYAGLLF
jgi:AmmeMemoRadiSam system protein B